MMANAVEMQQLLMSMDPSSANQFNMMNNGGACVLTSSGGSASPTSSSGAPSSASIEADEKEQLAQHLLQSGLGAAVASGAVPNQWMSVLFPSQQPQASETKAKAADVSDLVQNSNLMDLLNNGEIAKFAAHFAAQQSKLAENEAEEQREPSPSPPPAAAVSLNSSLAAIMLPTTSSSTGCSAASTTSSVDSATSSVIVNGASTAVASSSVDDDEEGMPLMKRQKTGDETPVTPTAPTSQLMQSLLATMGLANPLQQAPQPPPQQTPQQQQQQAAQKMKDESLLFGNLFPQGLQGLPLMFQAPLHQQFTGMQDFDSLAALATPNNKGSGLKRQYSSNGKNFCDICKKEVCNKYFLRTHMLKMHGIVIDENKTVIANIDTLVKEREGEISFRCDTCRTMFKTRQQLRQHRQDAHGVLPPSTPRANGNKQSAGTPNGANNNSAPPSATPVVVEEKCAMCDKRVAPSMMMMHVAQDHLNVGSAMTNGTDLSQMMALFNQVTTRVQNNEEKETLLECNECSYKTRDPKNLELHHERHQKMNEAKQSRDEEEDVALKLTTEAALHMVVQNQNQFDGGDANGAALNLTFKNEGVKKEEGEEEKAVATNAHERNSHTSGSISPSGSIPEGFGKVLGNEQVFPTQTFLIRSNDKSGCFLEEFLAKIPVRTPVAGPCQIVFELLPTPVTDVV